MNTKKISKLNILENKLGTWENIKEDREAICKKKISNYVTIEIYMERNFDKSLNYYIYGCIPILLFQHVLNNFHFNTLKQAKNFVDENEELIKSNFDIAAKKIFNCMIKIEKKMNYE